MLFSTPRRRGLTLAGAAAALVGVITVGLTPSLAEVELANPDFEEADTLDGAPGWVFRGPGYSAALSPDAAFSGAQGLVITTSTDAPPDSGAYSALTQIVPADELRGHRVRLSATIKIEAEQATPAELWVRSDGPSGMLNLTNNGATRTPNGDWIDYDLVAPIDPEATSVALGFYFGGRGTVRIDSFRLSVLGPTSAGEVPPQPLTEDGIANLTAFARLYGDIRFFHPSDEAAEADWTETALAGVERVEAAASTDELREALLEVFAPLAPSLQILDEAAAAPRFDLAADDVVAWRRIGLGETEADYNLYHGERVAAPDDLPDFVSVELPRGLVAYMPLKAARDADGRSRPHATAAPLTSAKPDGFSPSGLDRTSRLASVIIAWNVLEHFYPYWDVVDVDWAEQLAESLRAAAVDPDEESFDATLHRLIAASQDGHGNINRPVTRTLLPLQWEMIEDALVITVVGDVDGVEVGDVVTAIDGRPIAEVLDERAEHAAGATPGWRRFKTLQLLAIGAPGQSRTLSLERGDGETVETTVRFPLGGGVQPVPSRPEVVAELEPGVLYVDLTRLDTATMNAELERMASAEALIFELRGYPADAAPMLLTYLANEPLSSAQFRVPTYRQPNQRDVEFDASGSWRLPLQTEPFAAERVVFLTNGGAISYAETIMGIVEAYQLGEIVGSPTAGTNGNIDRYTLPTGHQMIWTGMQVLKHDGSQHHGVGILPTIPVEPTIAGVRAGRDEVLEAGLAVARGEPL